MKAVTTTLQVIAGIGIFCALYLLWIAVHIDFSTPEKLRVPPPNRTPMDLQDLLPGHTIDSTLLVAFPHQAYLSNCNIWDVKNIHHNLLVMDSMGGQAAQELFSVTLTKELKLWGWNTSDKDSLNLILNWANEMVHYKGFCEEEVAMFYGVVADYWYQEITNVLGKMYQEDKYVRYHIWYRQLQLKCDEAVFGLSVGRSSLEKIILNTIDHNWAYLFKRFWGSTGVLFKIAVVLFALGGLVLAILGLKSLIRE